MSMYTKKAIRKLNWRKPAPTMYVLKTRAPKMYVLTFNSRISFPCEVSQTFIVPSLELQHSGKPISYGDTSIVSSNKSYN